MERDRASTPTQLKPPSGAGCFERLTGLGVLAGLLPSWLGMAGRWHWALDLFSHFRWQYLAACAVAVVWAVWRKQRLLLAAAILTLLLNAWLIGGLAWPREVNRDQVAAEPPLRVLSMNVLTSNHDVAAVKRAIGASDADVVFLMEVNHRWMDALSSLNERYPHRLALPRDDNFGVALFSKIPWRRQETLWLGEAGVPSVEIEVLYEGRELALIGTHPLPPSGGRASRMRNRQLEMLAEHVMEASVPVLLVGDLNATPWSEGMRLLTESGHLRFRSLSPPWTPTWRAGSAFAIPIDHALCTPPLVISRRTVGPDVGSDHRPLLITVGWKR